MVVARTISWTPPTSSRRSAVAGAGVAVCERGALWFSTRRGVAWRDRVDITLSQSGLNINSDAFHGFCNFCPQVLVTPTSTLWIRAHSYTRVVLCRRTGVHQTAVIMTGIVPWAPATWPSVNGSVCSCWCKASFAGCVWTTLWLRRISSCDRNNSSQSSYKLNAKGLSKWHNICCVEMYLILFKLYFQIWQIKIQMWTNWG